MANSNENKKLFFDPHFTPSPYRNRVNDPQVKLDDSVGSDPENIRRWMNVDLVTIDNDGNQEPITFTFSHYEFLEFQKQVHRIAEERDWNE